MSARDSLNLSESEGNCVVCFKNVDILSVGVCDHPVCFECSTRMRVLCNQLECPICRQEMPKVIFTKEIEPFATLYPIVEKQNLQERKLGIYFVSPSVQRRYYRLLEHECVICKRNGSNSMFRTFQQLKDHMRRNHELFYCELCIANLKIFTFERSFYTRIELATHRRKGDANNTSHKGHPLCEFCETRFMDNDELFRHLRRDHLFCHFCDVDGKHQYYNAYDDLRRHYLEEHYLCEEGDCKFERFTSVFRSVIDLKAHYAAVHGRNLSKAANRQARTLEVEFTLAPRPRPDTNSTGGRHYGNRHVDRQHIEEEVVQYDFEPGGPGGGLENSSLFSNPLASENFPSLSGDASGPRTTVSNVTITSKLNPLSDENFPSLSGSNSVPPRSSAVTITTGKFKSHNSDDFPSLGNVVSARQPAVTITRTVRGQQALQRNSANFPLLKETSTSASSSGVQVNSNSTTSGSVRLSVNTKLQEQPSAVNVPKVSIHLNHKTNAITSITHTTKSPTVSVRPKTVEAFPALSSMHPPSQPQWVPQKAKKPEPKVSKVAPAPVLPTNSLNDFPTLSKSRTDPKNKKSTVNVPVTQTWVNLNNFNNNAKSTAAPSISSESQTQDKNQSVKTTNTKTTNNPQVTEQNDKNKTKKKKGQIDLSGTSSSFDSLTLDNNERNEVKTAPIMNGNTKKRSELKIGTLREPKVQQTSKPPPGFSVKPPPGFNNFILPNNDLTFTSSSGQSYSITPTQQYYPPSNFKSRNQSLIEKFKITFENDTSIQQFKVYSDMFRVGEIPAEKYYHHCQNFMGSEFGMIFPELLVLLPNVDRQQELYKVHRIGGNVKGLEVCATCKQVILASDLRNHLSNHALDNHFPVLNKTQLESNNVWAKK